MQVGVSAVSHGKEKQGENDEEGSKGREKEYGKYWTYNKQKTAKSFTPYTSAHSHIHGIDRLDGWGASDVVLSQLSTLRLS